ncbi:hypothetical protein EVAR_51406_1 [Eumeta japonica]|uniref:Mariner Mos1 transposase n=1 Tax=Eumeta variegata TaxID=151549 RepID=A0A4C1XYQ3_EUMVA|nr:hypothetical protein EVAR_51406_1 [Eumeta japonica]
MFGLDSAQLEYRSKTGDEFGSMRMTPKLNNNQLSVFQDEPNSTKVIRAKSTLKQRNYARCHMSTETTLFLKGQKIELTGHPPYNPDLAPNDFYLFPSLKNNYVVNVFRAAKRPLMRLNSHFRNTSIRQEKVL